MAGAPACDPTFTRPAQYFGVRAAGPVARGRPGSTVSPAVPIPAVPRSQPTSTPDGAPTSDRTDSPAPADHPAARPLDHPADGELLALRELDLVEVPPAAVPPGEQQAADRAWSAAVEANPHLFDGPAVACAGFDRPEPDRLVLRWFRVGYRFFTLARVPGATAARPGLFVSVVQPTDDGRLLIGRMADTTAAPGRWQPPGGTVEPPAAGAPLDAAALQGHAARELAEETGVRVAPGDLVRWFVKWGSGAPADDRTGRGGHIGVVYLAPPRPEAELRAAYAALAAAERAAGTGPELDRIAFIGSLEDLSALPGPHAAYLIPLIKHFRAGRGLPAA